MEDKKKIDELFQKKFKDLEVDPGMNTWEPIREKLITEKHRKNVIYWRWAGTAAAILFAFYSGYYFNADRDVSRQYAPPAENISNMKSPYPEFQSSPDYGQNSEPGNLQEDITPEIQSEDQVIAKGPVRGEGTSKDHYLPSPSFTDIKKDEQNTQGFPRQRVIRLYVETLNVNIAHAGERHIKTSIPENELSLIQESDPALPEQDIVYYYPQKEENPEDNATFFQRLGLSAIAGPTFAFRDVSVKNDNEIIQQNVDNEQLENSYAAGVNIHYQTDSRWEIQAGFFVNNWEQHSDNMLLKGSASAVSNTTFSGEGTTSSGSVSLDNLSLQSDISFMPTSGNQDVYALLPGIDQQYNFIEIPLSVGYYLLNDKRWSIKVNAGLNSRFLTGSEVRLIYADGSEKIYDGLRLEDFSLQIIGGTGFGYRLSKKLQLNLQPSVLYGVTPVNSNMEVKTYFHQVLIYSGLTYSF